MIKQTKTKSQETLDFKKKNQMQTFSFNPPIDFVEEGKWLLAVTSLEFNNSVFKKTNKNNSFSISTRDEVIGALKRVRNLLTK